ncbi:MAG TPA: hypothetical protein VGB13_04460 [Candidatus Krumholzibacteria bacterium]
MRYETRTTPEGDVYKHPVPEGTDDLPVIPRDVKAKLLTLVEQLYAEGRLIRGTVVTNGSSYCVLGVASLLAGCSFSSNWSTLIHTNNSGPYGSGSGKPVTPSGFAELMLLLKECPEER